VIPHPPGYDLKRKYWVLLNRIRSRHRNLMTAINVWAVSVVRYLAGILDWTWKLELARMDVKTWRILTMNGIFHKKGNVDRVYL